MATDLSEFKDVSDIAKEIVVSSSDSESSDNEINECDSFFSDSNAGENEATNVEHGSETTSELSSLPMRTPGSTIVPSLLDVLRAPKLSEIKRKRKTYDNAHGSKRRKAEPKTV